MPLDSLREAPAQLTTFLSAIDWSAPSWDLFIFLFFIIASLLYGFSLGRERIMVILVSIYMSLVIVDALPFTVSIATEIGIQKVFLFQIFSFLGLFITLFFFLSRSALLVSLGRKSNGPWWQIFFFSFLHVGLIISAVLSFLPVEAIDSLAPWTQTVFVSAVGHFVWIVAPVFGMIVSCDRDSD